MHELLKAARPDSGPVAVPAPAPKAAAVGIFSAVVLAGTRSEGDPVADFVGVDCKALAPILGKPMIQYVLEALAATPGIGSIVLVGDVGADLSGAVAAVRRLNPALPFKRMDAAASVSASVRQVLDSLAPGTPALVTTADNALLTPEIVGEFLDCAAGQVGVSAGFVERTVIEAAYPGSLRTYLKFRDAALSGANLFAFQGDRARNLLQFWERIESYRKRPLRMIQAFGLVNLFGMATRRFTLETAFRRAGAVVGCRTRAIRLSVAEAAMDVDSPRDYFAAERILARRQAAGDAPAQSWPRLVRPAPEDGVRGVAVFDLDRTITCVGTFTPFLLSSRDSLPAKAVLMARIARQMLRYVRGRIDRFTLKNRMLALAFSGMDPDAVRALADRFVRRTVARGLRPGCRLAIGMHRMGGDRLVLATAGIDLYADLFARYLGFDEVICTPTAFAARGNPPLFIAGENCYGAEKRRRVEAALLASGTVDRTHLHVSVYTDHRSDLALLDWADVAVVVSPDRKTRGVAKARAMTILNW
ncbi:MAG: hypothetical protein EP335_07800 [Alphaproteobacteria bacterium]|nr:MAG: hypothetical protein EP335_07800 [Alphaproteobacteria bacterium]